MVLDPLPDFTALGVFHFGDHNKSCPIQALSDVLGKVGGSLENMLIVLPEAFNVPDGYYCGTGPEPSIRKSLVSLSKEHKIAFVAGLIDEQRIALDKPGYNSAYLIDAHCGQPERLIARKSKDCPSALCTPEQSYVSIPLAHRGLHIAALICNDFMDCDQDTKTRLIDHENWKSATRKVLCVPSCSSYGDRLKLNAERWPSEVCIAAANGVGQDKSCIHGGCFETKLLPNNLTFHYQNEIMLTQVPPN